MSDANKGSFALSGANARFRARNSAIFGKLSGLEEKHEKEVSKDDPFSENNQEKKQPRKPQRVPQHVLHPEQWTKYSLEEDGTESLLEEGKTPEELNRDAALGFLADLQKTKDSGDEKDDTNPSDTSLQETCSTTSFKGVKRKREQVELDDETSVDEKATDSMVTRSTGETHAFRMQTYEFGQKQPRPSTSKEHVKASNKELSLSHLGNGEERNASSEIETKSGENEEVVAKSKTKFITRKMEKKHMRKSINASEVDDE